ncbi:MAG: T9SS type A sorting domain-containing protein [Crocinitomicaceae bacterium]|nr:T9SS type A sorting domain-containing protein [Crocinitomicaceae bacterium]
MKKTLQFLKLGVFSAGLLFSGLTYSQTTYTFTTGGNAGTTGPAQATMDAAYTGTNLQGNVTVTGGIQYWTVPTTGNYSIEAFGAQGYGPFGGRGAHIYGEFNLTAGTVIKILVGQEAPPYLNFPATTYNNQYGGGGGSFVTNTSDVPYIVAGGGGGSHATAYITSNDGQVSQNGAAGANASIIGAGGTNGNGGQQASSADGGGGLLTNGAGIAGGIAYVNGGNGGFDEGFGGFGCGGGTSSWNNFRGGGGGGYSGGGGANNSGSCCPSAGGGGSFNGGTNPVDLAGIQLGDGQVVITSLCAPTGLTADQASLTDITAACIIQASDVPVPTATNSCATAIPGTPDVTFPITTVGTTVCTWSWDDGVSQITQTQNLIVTGNDITPPVPNDASLPDLTGECEVQAPSPAPGATDDCSPPMFATPDVTFPITTQGTTVVTWTFTDNNGNSSTLTQNVILADTVAPVLDQTSINDEEGCSSVTPIAAPTATDNCVNIISGVADVTFPITTPGTTVVTWSFDDGAGNVVTQTQNVTVLTVDNSTSVSGTTISATASGVTYQWIDCSTNDPIAGETNQSYTPTATGDYAVIVDDGTCSDTSACVLVDFTGIDELDSELISIYPNPTTSGVFTVEFDGNIDEIVLIDALGRVIEVSADISTGSVDGSTLAPGKYTVKVLTSTSVYTKGLVILK